jgi:hypothetical protein
MTDLRLDNFIEGETAEEREERLIAITKLMPLKPEWCKHEDPPCELRKYAPDNTCPCGVRKHHYHGMCGGIIQVG